MASLRNYADRRIAELRAELRRLAALPRYWRGEYVAAHIDQREREIRAELRRWGVDA